MTEAESSSPLETITSASRPTLVAVDFSDDSRAALAWASAFSACAGGKLVVLHVVHDPATQPGYYRDGREKSLRPMEHVAEGMLDDFLAELRREHPELTALEKAEKKLLRGLPPSRIVEVAGLINAKLIVIGSRGQTGIPHLMQGSVSERVVELARRPVVVVKAPGNRQLEEKQRKKEEKERKKAEKARKKQEKKAVKAAPAGGQADPGRDRDDG
jgi:nucleotide-binding universal stress UspA family protein